MKRQLFAVAYLRTASREPENIEKLLKQLNACHKAAMKRHTAIAEVFIDYGYSGSTTERAGLYDLLCAIGKDQTIGYVIAADPARIARSAGVAKWIEPCIAEAGCFLIYADGSQPATLTDREKSA